MKRCPNCSHENKDTANFCIRCGARLDGKKPCPACGTVNDPDAAFCEKCGTALSDGGRVAPTAPAAPNPVPIPPAGTGSAASPAAGGQRISAQSANAGAAGTKSPFIAALSPRLLEMIRAGATLCFSLILFILSFFGVCKANMAYELQSDDFQTPYAVEITATDVIGGAFAWIDPPSADDRMQDFIIYIAEHLDPGEIPDAQDPGYAYALLGREMLEKYNPIKFAATEEAAEYSPNTVTELWIAAVFCLAYILLSAAFFVASAVDFAFVLRGRKRIKAPLRLAVLSLAALLLSVFYLSGVFSAGWSGMAGAGIAAIVIVLAAVAVDFVLRLLADKMTGTAEKTRLSRVFRRITAGAGAALSLIVLVLAGSAAVSVVCSVDSVSVLAFRGGYSASSLSNAWGMLLSAQDNPDLYGTAGTVIPGAFASLYSSIRGELLAPSNMGVLGNAAVEIPFAIIGVCADVCVAAAVVTGVLALANGISSASSGKKPSLVYPVLLLVFTLLIAVLSGICCGFANEGLSDVPGIQYTAKLAAAPVVAVVLAAVNLAQRITLGAIGRKREKAEAENEKTPSDETQTAGAGM